MVLLHLSTARAYTGGSGASNRPSLPQGLPQPLDQARPLPPSLQTTSRRRPPKRPCTLHDLWGQGTISKKPRLSTPPDAASQPFSWRLSLVPGGHPCQLEFRLQWKEYVGPTVAREAYPLWDHLWYPTATPSWTSWLGLTIGYSLTLGRQPPPYHRPTKRWLAEAERARWPDCATSVHDFVAAFKALLGPLLTQLGWPQAPLRVPGHHPVLCTPLPLTAWRWCPEVYHQVLTVLRDWYPHGLRRAADLRCTKPWPRTAMIGPAAEDLFSAGVAGPFPPIKRRRR